MFNFNSNKMFFMFILIFSTLISISSNSWLGCWIGLEINLLSFIPLISNVNNLLSSEAALKYFLAQSIASINFLFIILFKIFFLKNFEFNNYTTIIMNIPLLMKMGSTPFHFWFPNIIESLSWMNCLIIMTWQKISPLILLMYLFNEKFLSIIMTLNVLIGALGGMNQTSLRKLLAFSSINNLGWMMSSLMISENLWIMYFSIYLLLNLILCLMFYYFNIFFLNQIYLINFKISIKIFLLFNLLSLGGLPPLLGFFPKWLVINFLINNNFFLLTFVFIMMSLIMLFLYIRISYSSFLMNYIKLKWFKIKNKNKSLIIMNFFNTLSLMSLPLSTFFFYL